MLVAAIDTTSATLVWAMTALIQNPRVMKKVQEEIRNFGCKKEFLDENDIQNFTYMKAVIKETLRLYLPAPLLVPRESREKCTISGYNIPANTIVYVNAWAIQRDPNVWKNPEEFYPERFLESSINFIGQDFELIPFGAGRRICPGMSLGVASIEIILANLLFSFDWKLPHGLVIEDVDIEMLPGITQHKKNPLCLVAKIPML
jgi:cytochrome P450